MASPRRIDVHFHHIPPFYSEAVYEAGRGPAIGKYPDWTPQLALELMDSHGIEVALTSLAQPGVGFGNEASAQTLARRCNDYAADLVARWPRRFGAFATVPMWSIEGAIAEITHCLDVLKFDGVSLFASYEEKFLGDPWFDPVMERLNARGAVVFVHPGLHPSSKGLALPWPAFMMEYLFDTTRAVVNLIFSGAIERFPRIQFILPHAGGLVPYFAWRLSVSPMIDKRLPQLVARAGVRGPCALLVRQRARTGRADLRRARSRGAAGADRVRHRLSVRQSARDRRGGEDPRVRICPTRGAPRSIAAMRWRCFRSTHERYFAIASTSGDTSPASATDHTRSLSSFARSAPSTGPTRSRNFAFSPASSSGTMREPSASSAWRVNLPRAVVTVTRAGRSRG